MNNQQTQFSVRVSKGDFLDKAKEAYENYLSKTDIENVHQLRIKRYELNQLEQLFYKHFKHEIQLDTPSEVATGICEANVSIYSYEKCEYIKSLIELLSISTDEFVNVTEDIYKLIYKCDS